MKCLIFLAFIAFGFAEYAPGYDHGGHSNQFRKQDHLGNYEFGYDEDHASGGSFRKEKGDKWGNKVGSYGLHDADGRLRIVEYVADEFGFRAKIKSNEPGVVSQHSGAASIKKDPITAPIAAPYFAGGSGVIPLHTSGSISPVKVAGPSVIGSPLHGYGHGRYVGYGGHGGYGGQGGYGGHGLQGGYGGHGGHGGHGAYSPHVYDGYGRGHGGYGHLGDHNYGIGYKSFAPHGYVYNYIRK